MLTSRCWFGSAEQELRKGAPTEVTIVGPGGIGKTTAALAVADRLNASYKDGTRFVDLAPAGDPSLVPSVLASVLGVAICSEYPTPR